MISKTPPADLSNTDCSNTEKPKKGDTATTIQPSTLPITTNAKYCQILETYLN